MDEVQGDLQLDAYSLTTPHPGPHPGPRRPHRGRPRLQRGGRPPLSPSSGSAGVLPRYGADVLSWHAGPRPAPAVPTAIASGAASDQGSEKWHWLTRDPASGGTSTRVIAAFRTKDAADQLNQALSDRASRAALRGQVLLVGRAGVRPGARGGGDGPALRRPGHPAGPFGGARADARTGFTTG